MKKSLIVVLIFFITSCNKEIKRESKYENGQVKELYYVIKEKDNFIKNGKSKSWYKNGKLKHTGIYENGKPINKFSYWHENGNQMAEIEYNKKGEKNGNETIWYNNKIKASEKHFVNGKLDGISNHWNKKNELYASFNYKDNKNINFPAIYKNKKSNEKISFYNDNKYEFKVKEGDMFTSFWVTKKGSFDIMNGAIDFTNYHGFYLKNFTSKIIILNNGKKNITFNRIENSD